jgi:hypothetical protein
VVQIFFRTVGSNAIILLKRGSRRRRPFPLSSLLLLPSSPLTTASPPAAAAAAAAVGACYSFSANGGSLLNGREGQSRMKKYLLRLHNYSGSRMTLGPMKHFEEASAKLHFFVLPLLLSSSAGWSLSVSYPSLLPGKGFFLH